jgi:hypothetical protein
MPPANEKSSIAQVLKGIAAVIVAIGGLTGIVTVIMPLFHHSQSTAALPPPGANKLSPAADSFDIEGVWAGETGDNYHGFWQIELEKGPTGKNVQGTVTLLCQPRSFHRSLSSTYSTWDGHLLHLDVISSPLPDGTPLPPNFKKAPDDVFDLQRIGSELRGSIIFGFPAGTTTPISFRKGSVVCPESE